MGDNARYPDYLVEGSIERLLFCDFSSFSNWPTPALLITEFPAKRTTAFHYKAEILESLISVFRTHPNGRGCVKTQISKS